MKINVEILKYHDHVELEISTKQGDRTWSTCQRFDEEPGHAQKVESIGTMVLELMEVIG